jgi:glycosyltransferase involved in cell wall biosynthesis
MNLVFISPFPPSQVTLNEYGYHLTRSFIGKKGIDKITVLTNHLENDEDYKAFATEGLEIIPCWNFNSLTVLFDLRKTLKNIQADVIIMNIQFMTFGSGKIQAALGLLAPWLFKSMGIPCVVILHNITETVKLDAIGMSNSPFKSKLFLWIGRQLTKFILKADIVGVTISQYVKILKEKYQANNVVLLPHGNFELPERKPISIPLQSINLMAFGKFGTYKKVEVMIEAMQILQTKFPQLHFKATIAGTDNPNVIGYLDSVKAKYEHLSDIIFTGYVPESKVAEVFWDSTFVVFPYTTTTGSSGILHQAAGYGRACILPKIDDLERLLEEEGYHGAYFEPENAQSLANAIENLITHPEIREEIEDKNYKVAKGLPMNELSHWYLGHIDQLLRLKNR